MTNTKVVLLGTGTPALAPGRYQIATAIIVDDQPYIERKWKYMVHPVPGK